MSDDVHASNGDELKSLDRLMEYIRKVLMESFSNGRFAVHGWSFMWNGFAGLLCSFHFKV